MVRGQVLHLSSAPGGTAPLQTVGSVEDLVDVLAVVPGIALPAENLYKPVSAGRTYTDLELTSLTRAEEDTANQAVLESVGKLVKAANDARAALVAASLTVPANAANREAKAKALADAETALANARAITLAPLVKKILPKANDALIRAAASTMETRATARAARAAQ